MQCVWRNWTKNRKFCLNWEMKVVFASNSDFVILISLQPNGPKIFQTLHFVRSNCLCLKCQRFTPSGVKDIGFIKFMFVANIQFLHWNSPHSVPSTLPFKTKNVMFKMSLFFFICLLMIQYWSPRFYEKIKGT